MCECAVCGCVRCERDRETERETFWETVGEGGSQETWEEGLEPAIPSLGRCHHGPQSSSWARGRRGAGQKRLAGLCHLGRVTLGSHPLFWRVCL